MSATSRPSPTRHPSSTRHVRDVRRRWDDATDADVVTGMRRTRRIYLRRRLLALATLSLLVVALTLGLGRVGAQAGLEDPVGGHVVAAPGDTLWDVAVATAPDGMDPRRQLDDLRELNGIEGSHLGAWSVVLVPAR